MSKVVINNCYGGFSLSLEGMVRYSELIGKKVWMEKDEQFKSIGIYTYWTVPPEERTGILTHDEWCAAPMHERKASNERYEEITLSCRKFERDDPALVQVVEELGEKSWGSHAQLCVVDVPDDVQWIIEEYDGSEWVAEVHRKWYGDAE